MEDVKIIKNGDLELYKRKKLNIKRFKCYHCTCEFDATNKYYKSDQFDGVYAECPCCKEYAYEYTEATSD